MSPRSFSGIWATYSSLAHEIVSWGQWEDLNSSGLYMKPPAAPLFREEMACAILIEEVKLAGGSSTFVVTDDPLEEYVFVPLICEE